MKDSNTRIRRLRSSAKLDKDNNDSAMEVETRPSLAEDRLMLDHLRESDLVLSVTEDDLLSGNDDADKSSSEDDSPCNDQPISNGFVNSPPEDVDQSNQESNDKLFTAKGEPSPSDVFRTTPSESDALSEPNQSVLKDKINVSEIVSDLKAEESGVSLAEGSDSDNKADLKPKLNGVVDESEANDTELSEESTKVHVIGEEMNGILENNDDGVCSAPEDIKVEEKKERVEDFTEFVSNQDLIIENCAGSLDGLDEFVGEKSSEAPQPDESCVNSDKICEEDTCDKSEDKTEISGESAPKDEIVDEDVGKVEDESIKPEDEIMKEEEDVIGESLETLNGEIEADSVSADVNTSEKPSTDEVMELEAASVVETTFEVEPMEDDADEKPVEDLEMKDVEETCLVEGTVASPAHETIDPTSECEIVQDIDDVTIEDAMDASPSETTQLENDEVTDETSKPPPSECESTNDENVEETSERRDESRIFDVELEGGSDEMDSQDCISVEPDKFGDDIQEAAEPVPSSSLEPADVAVENGGEDQKGSVGKKIVKRRASEESSSVNPPPTKLPRRSSAADTSKNNGDLIGTMREFQTLRTKVASKVVEEASANEATPKPVRNGDGSSETPVVIDLDDDEGEEQSEERVTKDEATTSMVNALDDLFQGDGTITLDKKMFLKILLSTLCQYMLSFGVVGDIKTLQAKAWDTINKVHSTTQTFKKQKNDVISVMKKLLADREANKTWDANLVPVKITRSVGLQVGPSGVKGVANSSVNCDQAAAMQKRAYVKQVEEQKKRPFLQQFQLAQANRPIAKKSSVPWTPRQAQAPAVANTTPPAPPTTSVTTQQRLNGISKSVTVSRNPVPATPPQAKRPVVPAQQTPAAPKTTTILRTTTGQSPSSALMSALTTGKTVTISSQSNGTKIPGITVSGPGRPQNGGETTLTRTTPATEANKKTSLPAEATIDLTDGDEDTAASRPKAPVARTSFPSARKSTSRQPNSQSDSSRVQRICPPLPPLPSNFNASTAPPKPHLRISNSQEVMQGIMLTWFFNQTPVRKISKFQVFAYQEGSDADETWKKVGDVDALVLPMACTLTQFTEGYTYHFVVRAIDESGNIGPFSAPSTIMLTKKN